MTCAECNDLLLDLAYGEIEGPRAAEVADHARQCARCGPSLSELLRVRRAAAPLAEVEEPPSRMDEAVLEAARAQAFLLSGGTPGAVVETAAREQARAVEPLRVDARARVRRGEGGKGGRAWIFRAAIAGSVAAAAGLAVLVSTSGRKPAPRSDEADFRIQIHAPQDAAAPAPSAARPSAPPATAAPPHATAAAPSAAAPPPASTAAQPPASATAQPPASSAAPPAPGPARTASRAQAPAAPPPPAAPPVAFEAPPIVSGAPSASGTGPVRPAARATAQAPSAPASAAERAENTTGTGSNAASADKSGAAVPPAQAKAQAQQLEAPAADAASVEQRAASARRGGAYAAAGVLYRQAAGLRGARGDADGAGWDLAHAVECFAAAGDFAQARKARRELQRSGSAAAQGAADRALRTAPPESAAEASPGR